MSDGILSKLLKKGFYLDLDKEPSCIEEFLSEIERCLTKERHVFEIVQRTKPAIVSIDNIEYKCDLSYNGRSGWSLNFKEI